MSLKVNTLDKYFVQIKQLVKDRAKNFLV